MRVKTFILGLLLAIISVGSSGQTIIKDIKSFGAKGDGKTNDTQAFEDAAAFFNARGGNGTLLISTGMYIVGRQKYHKNATAGNSYSGEDILSFSKVKNLVIKGETGSLIKYADGLRFGAFDPGSGLAFNHPSGLFLKPGYAASVGVCISLNNCDGISIIGVSMNGNNAQLQLGGSWGDVGRQLPHVGIFIQNSHDISINNVNASYFGLDGIEIANDRSNQPDNIQLLNSVFEYNSRQGFSWVGGNGIVVKNCSFNHTGKNKFSSNPAAGVDIEAERGPNRNGVFDNCEFIDNAGCGMVSDSGDDSDCSFSNCTFWGTSFWSAWIKKPRFTFSNCNFYGSIVWGYDSPNDRDATRFLKCHFEDRPYNGKQPYGNFLIETNGAKRMSFEGCTLIANHAKLAWLSTGVSSPEEKYKVYDCHLVVMGAAYPKSDYMAIVRGVDYKNNILEFKDAAAKNKGYWLDGITVDATNKTVYDK